MTTIRLQQFSGVAPKISDRLLPENMAATANNLRLLSGELRGINSPRPIHYFNDSTILSSFRIPDTPDDIWMGFTANDVDVVEGPIVNDIYERYYWTGDPDNQYVTFNSKDFIAAGAAFGAAYSSAFGDGFATTNTARGPFRVGVPAPASLTIGAITVPNGTVSGATNANPAVITVTGHPFSEGDVVTFSGVIGMHELNGNEYVVTDTDTNTITLNVDSSSFGTWSSGGTQVVEEYSAIETRAYTYTYVNEFGEESAPADPVLASGRSDGTWALSGISDSALPSDYASMTNRRIYRTVTGQDSSQYYFVAELALTGTTYNDSESNADVVQNSILETWDWDVPDAELKGLLAHPSGFLVAFKDHEIHCSERFRPHAWPTEYIIALNHDVVGIAIWANTLVALTTSAPYFIHGTHPTNLVPDKSDSVEPCLSKRSIVSTLQGVLYASSNGLVLFNQQGAMVATNPLISDDEWKTEFSPETVYAAQQALQYLAFKDPGNGFEFSPAEPLGILSTFDRFQGVDNIQTDEYDGTVRLMAGGIAYEWDATGQIPVYYRWLSKVFDFPRPVNMGACIVKLEGTLDPPPPDDDLERWETWNTERMGGTFEGTGSLGDVSFRALNELNPMGYTPLASPRTLLWPEIDGTKENFPTSSDETSAQDRRRYPVGGSPLFNATGLSISPADRAAQLNVYADGELIVTLNIVPNEMMRLPSGFMAHTWQFEIVSNANIYSLAVAETGKGLKDV